MDDDAHATAAPPARVRASFGCTGEPEPLAGGRGTAWRCGDLVLKPLDGPAGAVAWAERVLGGPRRSDEVRWTAPVRSVGGHLVVDGWTAWTHVEGRHEPRRWAEAIRAGEAFAAALAGSPRPGFLDARSDPWAVADRAAWGECDVPGADDVPEIRALRAALRPVDLPAQVVHGDLTGNVLLAAALPPAVIDPSVYWRPVGYGSAVVVVDALASEGATVDLLRAPRARDELPQLLLRAALFRLLTDHVTGAPPSARAAWGPVVATLRRLACP